MSLIILQVNYLIKTIDTKIVTATAIYFFPKRNKCTSFCFFMLYIVVYHCEICFTPRMINPLSAMASNEERLLTRI